MLKQYDSFKILLIFFLLLLTTTACTQEAISEDVAGYVSADEGSMYKETFDNLGIGRVFNYDFHVLKADESWVSIWLEGYRNGKLIEPSALSSMNYGLSLNEEERGKMGFGIINSNKEPLVFFYSNGTSIYPNMIQDDVFLNKGISAWDDGMNEEKITLNYGEEKILAVYRQNENTMPSGYDYQDAEAIKEIIKDSETVLFFKVKIEKAK